MSFVCKKCESEITKTLHGAVPRPKVIKYLCVFIMNIFYFFNLPSQKDYATTQHIHTHPFTHFLPILSSLECKGDWGLWARVEAHPGQVNSIKYSLRCSLKKLKTYFLQYQTVDLSSCRFVV